jgi:hypothetical protein
MGTSDKIEKSSPQFAPLFFLGKERGKLRLSPAQRLEVIGAQVLAEWTLKKMSEHFRNCACLGVEVANRCGMLTAAFC